MGQATRVWCDICRCTIDGGMRVYNLAAVNWPTTCGDFVFDLRQVCRPCAVRVNEFIDRIKVQE